MKKAKDKNKKLEQKALKEANKDYIDLQEKIVSNNRFYYLTIGVVVVLLVGLFLLLHFTNVI